jgi:hypothetical protein
MRWKMRKIRLKLPISKELLVKFYGDKCPDYDRLCVVCKAWRTYEKAYYVDVKVNREALFNFIMSDDNV